MIMKTTCLALSARYPYRSRMAVDVARSEGQGTLQSTFREVWDPAYAEPDPAFQAVFACTSMVTWASSCTLSSRIRYSVTGFGSTLRIEMMAP